MKIEFLHLKYTVYRSYKMKNFDNLSNLQMQSRFDALFVCLFESLLTNVSSIPGRSLLTGFVPQNGRSILYRQGQIPSWITRSP